MFQLQTGSYLALEKAFLGDLLTLKKAEPLANCLVLSPSAHLLTHLQSLVAVQTPGFINIHCMTFYALAEKLMQEGPLSPDRVVSEPALYREIIHDFLNGQEEIPFISREALLRSPGPIPRGLPGALAATLKDLQDSGARVVDCAQVAREGHLGDALESAIPALELNVLMYDVLRKHKLRTGADFIRRVASRISQSPWIKNQVTILLYGFYDLTGVQLEFILELAKHPRAKIYFPYEEGNPAYSYAEKLLKDPAFTSKCSTRRHGDTETPANKALDDSPRHRVAASPDLKTEAWSCSGAQNEIWLVAKRILEWVEAGIPFPRIAVQARTLEPYLNTIREVFEAHHIPYALAAEEPVGAYPLIKNAWELLRSNSEEINAPWSVHVSWAKTQLTQSNVLPKDAEAIEHQLWEGLMNALEALSELDLLGRPTSRERFLEVLGERLEGLRLALTPENVAGVQVMDVMTARGLSFDAVLLVGLNEKLFPRLIREDPFLPDNARSGLAQALGCRLSRKLDGYQEERLLFELAVQSARKRLHLSCQRSDEEGKALVVSLYLHDFIKNAALELKRLPRSWPEKIALVPSETLTPKEVSLALQRENRDADPLYRALGWDIEWIHHLLRSQAEIESFGPLGAHDGLIGKNHPLAQAILAKGLSPNTLKDLAECPFKIYSRKILSLDPDENEVENGELTHASRGKIVHEILETFYQGPTSGWEKRLDQISRDVFAHFEKDYPELYPLAWLAEKNKILTMLKRFIPLDVANLIESGLVPKYFEARLSHEIDKVLLQGRIDRLDIREGIQPAFRVVDYKTGTGGLNKKEKVETAILKGKNFQLPVYLALAEAWLKGQGIEVKEGSAVFYHLQQEDALEAPLKIDSNFWEDYSDRFHKNLRFLVKDIETGSFYIRPSDSHGYCNWCHFSAICRKTHKPTQIRSESSTQHQEHEECLTP